MSDNYTPQVGDYVEVTLRGEVTAVVVSEIYVSDVEIPLDQDVTVRKTDPPKPPLPTEPGVYIPAGANLDRGPTVFVLDGRNGWRTTPYNKDAEGVARAWHERSGLVRLVPEGSAS